jgi:hypothetical protein
MAALTIAFSTSVGILIMRKLRANATYRAALRFMPEMFKGERSRHWRACRETKDHRPPPAKFLKMRDFCCAPQNTAQLSVSLELIVWSVAW